MDKVAALERQNAALRDAAARKDAVLAEASRACCAGVVLCFDVQAAYLSCLAPPSCFVCRRGHLPASVLVARVF